MKKEIKITEIKITEIEIGDIVLLKTIKELEEDGEEITDLVKEFAGKTMKVISIDNVINCFGERTYVLEELNKTTGLMSATDHEIAKIYKEL